MNQSDKLKEAAEAAKAYADNIVPSPSPNHSPYFTTGDRWDDLHDAFISGAEYALSLVENKWVSVEERLPEQKELVSVFDGRIVIPAIYYKSMPGFYKFSTGYLDCDTVYNKIKIQSKHRIENVTHWQPLPKSPF